MTEGNMTDVTADTNLDDLTGTLISGREAFGDLEAAGDRDRFSMDLIAGVEYRIEQRGQETDDGTLFDPQMYLYDREGLYIATNDDSGGQLNSQLLFTPATSGTYYLEAGGFSDLYSGTYTVALTATSDDYPDNLSPVVGLLEPGGTRIGLIETAGDRDWFGMDLIAGVEYRIEQRGQGTDDGTLRDPLMSLYDREGLHIATNDDSGEELNSQLLFTPTRSGTYYLEAGGFADFGTGSYTVALTVTDDAPNTPPNAANDNAVTEQDTPVTIDVLANDSDPDGDALALIPEMEGPSNGSVILNADNSLTYTPATGFVGTDRFYYMIEDGYGGTSGAVVTVTVEEATGPACETISAASTGDPHLRTFDGLGYDFQAAGEFILFRTEDGGSEYQVRQEPWRDSDYVAVNTALTTQLGDTVVGLYSNDETPLLVDGSPVTLARGEHLDVGTGTVSFDGRAYLITDELGNGVSASIYPSSGFMNLHPFVCSEHAGTIQGLLGDGDGTHANDFALRDGTVLPQPMKETLLYGLFADSWRISQDDSWFVYADGESTETFTDPRFPANVITLNELDPTARAEAEVIAEAAGLEPQTFIFETTVLDIALTGVDAFAEAAADIPDFVDEDASRETVTVELNRAPLVGADSATVPVDGTVDIDVLANDSDPEGEALTLLSVTDPAGGQAEIVDAQVRFTPAAGFNGETVLSYEVGDTADNIAEGLITVTVGHDEPEPEPEPEPLGEPTAFYTLTTDTPREFFLATGLDAQLLGDTSGKTVNIPMGATARAIDAATTVNLQGASTEYDLQRNGTTLEVRDAADASLSAILNASTTDSSSLRFRDGAVELAVENNNLALGGAVLGDGEQIAGSTLTLNGNLTSSGIFSGTPALPGSAVANAFLTLTASTPESFTFGEGLVLELLGDSAGKSLNVPTGAGVTKVDAATRVNLEGPSSAFSFTRNGTTLEVRDADENLAASLNASTTETSTLIFADGFMALAVDSGQITLGGATFNDGLRVAGNTLSVDDSETSEPIFGINLDALGGTAQTPAAVTADAGALTFFDAVSVASVTEIADFGADDRLELRGVSAEQVEVSVANGDVLFAFDNGAGDVSEITLLDIGAGLFTSIAEFNAAGLGDVVLPDEAPLLTETIDLDDLGGTVANPASANAAGATVTFLDAIARASRSEISDFGTDDALQFQGVNAADVAVSVIDGNTHFEFDNGAGTVSTIILLGVSGIYTDVDEFNANPNFGDVSVI